MNKEKQRIAIAVACGYKIIDSPTAEGFVRLQKPDGNPVCSVGSAGRRIKRGVQLGLGAVHGEPQAGRSGAFGGPKCKAAPKKQRRRPWTKINC